jgi:hypothetical protein
MALHKDTELSSGIIASYWRISVLEVRKESTLCVLELFKDAEARNLNKEAVLSKAVQWTEESHPCNISALDQENAYVLVYNALKLLPEWSGSTDV